MGLRPWLRGAGDRLLTGGRPVRSRIRPHIRMPLRGTLLNRMGSPLRRMARQHTVRPRRLPFLNLTPLRRVRPRRTLLRERLSRRRIRHHRR
jgi:hypothetical protein